MQATLEGGAAISWPPIPPACARMPLKLWILSNNRHACRTGNSSEMFREQARIREYRNLNVSLVIGGSVTAFLAVRSPGPPGRRNLHASQPPPLAETLFYSARRACLYSQRWRPGVTRSTSYRNGAFRNIFPSCRPKFKVFPVGDSCFRTVP